MSPGDKKYTNTLEYKKDSIDYETLKLEVNSPSKLGLIKEYLLTHKYKEFRDKANKLRVPLSNNWYGVILLPSRHTLMDY